jgi:hypothetical protein
MNYSNINPTIYEYCVCPFCGADSAASIVKYGYHRSSLVKDNRGDWHENHWPSSEGWLICGFCNVEVPDSELEVY